MMCWWWSVSTVHEHEMLFINKKTGCLTIDNVFRSPSSNTPLDKTITQVYWQTWKYWLPSLLRSIHFQSTSSSSTVQQYQEWEYFNNCYPSWKKEAELSNQNVNHIQIWEQFDNCDMGTQNCKLSNMVVTWSWSKTRCMLSQTKCSSSRF